MSIQLSLVVTALSVVLLATALLFLFIRDKLETDLGYDLLKVSMLTAPQISGEQHEAIQNNADSAGEEFRRIRDQLW